MTSKPRKIALPLEDELVDHVDAAVHAPAEGAPGLAVLLAPGAGGDLDTAGLVGLAEVIASLGHTAVRVNLPYRQAGRKGTPRADRSVDPYRAVFRAAKATVAAKRWVVGGKSYGGRVASMAVAEGLKASGVLCYGYPLHPPGKPENLRVDHWPDVPVPVAIIQGSRDTFGTPDEFTPHLGKFPRRTTMVAVEGGDHSCKVAGKYAPDGKPRKEAVALAQHAAELERWFDSLR